MSTGENTAAPGSALNIRKISEVRAAPRAGLMTAEGSDHDHAHAHEHHHDHSHPHSHDHSHWHPHGLEHFHTHRNIIGFDEHGIPTVILKAGHEDDPEKSDQDFIKDYSKALTEYRKTFPSKQDFIDNTPDPAVRDMILRAEQIGFDTCLEGKVFRYSVSALL